MTIILEESLLINFFIIYCILRFTGLVTKQKGRFYFLSSLYGSIIACAYPIFNIHGILKFVLLLSALSLITVTSFKFVSFKKFLLDFCIIILITFLLGGACLALQSIIGGFPLFIVASIGGVIFIILWGIERVVNHNNAIKKFTYKLKLIDEGNEIEEEGFLDSGNVLYDNITNKPIVLVNFTVFQKLYKDISYINARLQNINSSSIKNGHYIKINGIGKGTNMLVFTIDELILEDKYYKNVSVGLSFSGFEKSFGKNVLLHCDYV